MKFDLEILNRYVSEGWVEKNDHPTFPISIYNYSRNTQFEGRWDEITKQCRGLILDNEGNVVAKSFPKFFNMEEHKPEEIPNESFEVFEKLDGSLGILFYYGEQWNLATKGSFTSDQSVKGMEILKKYKYERLLEGYTYLFEIIYPENRIVCQYDFEDLILLAVIDNSDGYELRIHDDSIHLGGNRFRNLYNNLGFKIVKKYDGIKDFSILKNLISNDREGYVIRFENGFRMKIKGEEYVRLHRLLTNFSNVDIWEALKNGDDISKMLERVPDEFDAWVRKTINNLQIQFNEIKENVDKEYWTLINRKEYAEKIKDNPIRHLLFSRLTSYSPKYETSIWDMIRPVYQKPFWNKED